MGVSRIWRFVSSPGRLPPPWAEYNFLRWDPGVAMDFHQHPYLQSIHVLEGRLDIDWGDGWTALHPGDVHVLPPRHPHRIRTEQGHAQFGINFSTQHDERGLLEELLGTYREPVVRHVPFREVWRSNLAKPNPNAPILRVAHSLDDYALSLLEHGEPTERPASAEPLVSYLQARLGEPLRVDEIAAHMHMSRASLQRLCQKQFGCGAARLHERLRLEHAARQLLLTNLQVSECAVECGYQDIYHFSRAFKRVYGLPPSVYRRERRRELG